MSWQRNEPSSACTRCGLCCGMAHPDTGLVVPPFPPGIGTNMRTWLTDDIVASFPHSALVGAYPTDPDGKPRPQYYTGNKRINSGPYPSFRIKWTFDGGWHKPTNMECPCLVDDPGDGSRPCALIGSIYESLMSDVGQCGPDGAMCLLEMDDYNHADWVANMGEGGVGPGSVGVGCIFTWTEV